MSDFQATIGKNTYTLRAYRDAENKRVIFGDIEGVKFALEESHTVEGNLWYSPRYNSCLPLSCSRTYARLSASVDQRVLKEVLVEFNTYQQEIAKAIQEIRGLSNEEMISLGFGELITRR